MTHEEIVYKYLVDNNLLQENSLIIDLLPTPEDLAELEINPQRAFSNPFMRSFMETSYFARIDEGRYLVIEEDVYTQLKQDAENWKLLNP